jgi:hypothetical protein
MFGGNQKSTGRGRPGNDVGNGRTRPLLRVGCALSLLMVAAVHLNLYARADYNKIPTVGSLFLLAALSGAVLAAGLLVWHRAILVISAGLFASAVLAGYVLTLLLPDGLFSFKEPGISYSGYISIVAESAIVLFSVLMLVRQSRGSSRLRSVVATA